MGMEKEKFVSELKVELLNFIKIKGIDLDDEYHFDVSIVDGDVFLELWWGCMDYGVISEFMEYVYSFIIGHRESIYITLDEQHCSGNSYWYLAFKH